MCPRRSDSRQRLVSAAADMLAQHGFNATSIREMARRADAPLGSTYHYFPGGKQQMVVEAIRSAGARVSAGLEQYLQAGFEAGLRGFLDDWRDILVQADFRIGCPVMAVAVEEPVEGTAADVLAVAAGIFAAWEQQLVRALLAEGCEPTAASGLATLIVASVEGAIVLCRASRSIDPFDAVAVQLHRLARSSSELPVTTHVRAEVKASARSKAKAQEKAKAKAKAKVRRAGPPSA